MTNQTHKLQRFNFGEFSRSLNQTEHGYLQISDPTDLNREKPIERFEVRSGDCFSEGDWSDCLNDRERSEIKEHTPDTIIGKRYLYQFEVYIPLEFINVHPTKTSIIQFYLNKIAPLWMIQFNEEYLYIEGLETVNSTNPRQNLMKINEMREVWTTISIDIKWSDQQGYLELEIKNIKNSKENKNVFSFYGRTTKKSNELIYLKYGLYRSYLHRYKQKYGVEKVPSQYLYFKDVHRTAL